MLPGQLAITFPAEDRGRMPRGPVDRSAEFFGRNNEYRAELGRRWEPGPVVAWAGLNPSRADGRRDDPTMLREIGFSYRWGFGALVKVNIYPFCSATPAGLKTWRTSRAASRALLEQAAERAAAAIAGCDLFIAAWGAHALPADLDLWLRRVEQTLDRPIGWHALGTNADGSPRHTLSRGRNRVPDDAVPAMWSIRK